MVFEHYVILSSTSKVRPLVTLGPRYISVPICQVQTSSVRTIPFCQERLLLKCYHTSIEYCFIYFTRKPIAIHNSMETDRTEISTRSRSNKFTDRSNPSKSRTIRNNHDDVRLIFPYETTWLFLSDVH